METTGKAFVEHWSHTAEKGDMNKNTAAAMKAACVQVLSALDHWEQIDIRELDVEEALRRFQNLRAKKFKQKTLDAYARRFTQAVASYLAYVKDPRAWKPHGRERTARPRRVAGHVETVDNVIRDNEGARAARPPEGSLVEYPFPLRDGLTARLMLPRDLKSVEVKRLTAFMATLAVDFEPAASGA
jgi:hypothetical protein